MSNIKFGDAMEELIEKAKRNATRAHKGQTRKYGDKHPYIIHPEAVSTLVRTSSDVIPEMVAAAWLHDVVEDTDWTIEEVRTEFGQVIGDLVDELTNPSKQYPNFSRGKRKQIDRDHTANISDAAKTIKTADRLHNLKGILENAPKDFAEMYLYETVELFQLLTGANPCLMKMLWEEILRGLRKCLNTKPKEHPW